MGSSQGLPTAADDGTVELNFLQVSVPKPYQKT
jgi:hypothetical protein